MLLFAANWKMHTAPQEAREYLRRFLDRTPAREDREIWFFPPAVSLEAVAEGLAGRSDTRAGAQNVYWEPKGAFTGEISAALARGAGATTALVGHSERRHVFGETESETAKKVRALLEAGMIPVLCVGEKLEEREADETENVVLRQLGSACATLPEEELRRVVIAYEPVWAIGTGRNATPADAARVHAAIRSALRDRGAPDARILYGGSVNQKNIAQLLAEPEINGVLVGGASLDPDTWSAITGGAG